MTPRTSVKLKTPMKLAHMRVHEHTHIKRAAHPFEYGGWGGGGALQGEGQREVWLGLILRSVQHKRL